MVFSVALIGPDGAGKTTICRHLEKSMPVPVKYLYMGVSADSSNILLPTTRLIHAVKRAAGAAPDVHGPLDPKQVRSRPKALRKRIVSALRSSLRLLNRLGEEWFRQLLAWYYQLRGHIVLFDRHFYYDYYAYDVADNVEGRPLSRKIHGFILERIYPKPDLVIYLDAPGDVLFARKGEGTPEALENRRRDYLMLQSVVKNFVVVDVTSPQEVVLQDVAKLILDFYGVKKAIKGEYEQL
jgi:thymidylate kinase